MTTSTILPLILILGVLSCSTSDTSSISEHTHAGTTKEIESTTRTFNTDTFKRFTVDDYPVTNDMLLEQSRNNPYFTRKSGMTVSRDKAWFTNVTLRQFLVFELYTDYHRLVTYHFSDNSIPEDLMNRMELHTEKGDTVTHKQVQQDFKGLAKQSVKISSKYFTSEKGFTLGDTKEKAVTIYGLPDTKSIKKGLETFEWRFNGDENFDPKAIVKNKPLAKDSFGHHITMFFKNDKLVAVILHNDIP